MSKERLLREILEQILETDCDPADACRQHPELLPLVQKRLNQVQQVEQSLNNLFPASAPTSQTTSFDERRLPQVEGYVVESLLGSGGMGVVYKARHIKLNRVVALKMLRSGHFATSAELARFSREYQAIAEMHCHHIIQIYDIGDSDGRPYFTMELADGGSLAEKLNGTPQPAREAAELVAIVSEAIHSAHLRNVIHRDLKPGNILLTNDGSPKIADFGLSRHLNRDAPLTVSHTQLGTPSYMAPEQATKSASDLGPAVDIYALGAILYEMLTGRPPFRAETPVETLRQVIHVAAVSPARVNPSVPRDVETICLKCLNKNPSIRYLTAGHLADDLKRFLNHEPIHARPQSQFERTSRWLYRHPATAGFVISVFSFLCLTALFSLREYTNSQQRLAEMEAWNQRLVFVNRLEQEGRFTEAQKILGQVPTGSTQSLRKLIDKAREELKLAETLDSIRMNRGKFVPGGGIDYEESNQDYESVFRDAGIGAVFDPTIDVAKRIQASSVSLALVAALDDWAVCAPSDTRAWLLEVARLADPDPWRDQVRSKERWADLEHLQQLSESVDIKSQPVTILVAMGTRWRRLGGEPAEYLRRVHRIYPNDFWVNFELGVLSSIDSDSTDEIAYNLAALSIRPDATSVYFNLGSAYRRTNRLEDATYYLQRAVELDPNHSWATYQLALTLFETGHQTESVNQFQNAIRLDPNYKDARNGLRIAYIKLGKLEQAMTIWRTIFDLSDFNHDDVDGYAELCLFLGEEERYYEACDLLLKFFGQTENPFTCERVGRACILHPRNQQITNAAVELVDRACNTDLPSDQTWVKPYFLFAKALCDYRVGNFEAALSNLNGETSKILIPNPDLVKSMVLQKIGQTSESKAALQRAEEFLQQNDALQNREYWMSEILRREAKITSP